MDPITLLRTLWRHKWVALPVIVLTIASSMYIFIAQRSYTAGSTYALMAPKIPSDHDLEANPSLAKLNSDNPYLRSPDGLLSQVLITKLSVQDVASSLGRMGLSRDYTVTPGTSGPGIGFILQIQATGNSPSQAIATVGELGIQMASQLYAVQKVNGADDSYLYRAQLVQPADTAQEAYSSRLRSIIVISVAGTVLLFGSVSFARKIERGANSKRDEARRRNGLKAGDRGRIPSVADDLSRRLGADEESATSERKAGASVGRG